jgi:hypothetical protein
METGDDRSRVSGRIALALFYLGAAWGMAYYAVQLPLHRLINIETLIAGTAPRPFQFRVLGPWTILALQRATGLSLESAELLWHLASYLALFAAMRAWLRAFLPAAVADLAPVFVAGVFVNNLVLRYPWDAAGVFFITVLLDLARRGRWLPVFGVLAVATVNRENAYLVVPAVFLTAVFHRRVGLPRGVGLTVAAAAVWLGVKTALYHAFPDAAGGVLQWHVPENLAILAGRAPFLDFRHVPALAPLGTAVPWCWLQVLGALNFVWVLVPVRFATKDPLLRALAWLVPIHLTLLFLFGNLAERRVYLDLAPIVLPLALQTFFPPVRET